MVWDELQDGIWTLPAIRNKTKIDLARPLSRQALAVLPRKDGRYVFSSDGGKTPISGFSQFRRIFGRACGVEGWTIHDCRRTARTLLSRAGISSDVAERCLGHVLPGVRGVYDRHQYLDEMAAAYEALASLIKRIVNPTDNVTALRRATQS